MTTYLVFLHLCSFGLLRTFSQHSHRSLTGLPFQVSDVFTVMFGSRSSSCSHGGLVPLLLLLITGAPSTGQSGTVNRFDAPRCVCHSSRRGGGFNPTA